MTGKKIEKKLGPDPLGQSWAAFIIEHLNEVKKFLKKKYPEDFV